MLCCDRLCELRR